MYGFLGMFVLFLQASSEASGFTRVVDPLLVLAGEPANRSAFSQATMPDQLSVKTFPAIGKTSL
jgi:hypothetical protein